MAWSVSGVMVNDWSVPGGTETEPDGVMVPFVPAEAVMMRGVTVSTVKERVVVAQSPRLSWAATINVYRLSPSPEKVCGEPQPYGAAPKLHCMSTASGASNVNVTELVATVPPSPGPLVMTGAVAATANGKPVIDHNNTTAVTINACSIEIPAGLSQALYVCFMIIKKRLVNQDLIYVRRRAVLPSITGVRRYRMVY